MAQHELRILQNHGEFQSFGAGAGGGGVGDGGDGELAVVRGVAEVAVAGSGGELSLTVEPGWQHRHIATELTRRVLQSARNQWLADICIRYLRGNTPIGRIAGAVAHHTHADEGELVSGVRIPVPTPASVWNELLDESAGWAGDMLDRAASVPGPRP